MTTRILVGDCRDALKILPDQSVHCVVTSPPYWGLRSYGKDRGMIGLEESFSDHLANLIEAFREVRRVLRDDGTLWLNYGDAYAGSGKGAGGWSPKQASNQGSFDDAIKNNQGYRKDGFGPQQLMMMPARIALAMQEDGWQLRSEIVWNKVAPMPESVTNRPTSAHEKVFLFSKSSSTKFWTHPKLGGTRQRPEHDHYWVNKLTDEISHVEPEGWKDIRDDRGHKIWSRRNGWVGHNYFYDHIAVRTEMKESSRQRMDQATFDEQTGGPKDPKSGNRSHRLVLENLKKRTPKDIDGRSARMGREVGWRKNDKQRGHSRRHDGFNDRWDSMTKSEQQSNGANMRNVMSVTPAGFSGAHFATFPPALVIPFVSAGTSEAGCCSECGAPLARVAESALVPTAKAARTNVVDGRDDAADDNCGASNRQKDGWIPGWSKQFRTKGWAPTCDCEEARVVPCVVMDPFGGAGTLGLVADKLQRDAILIEINEGYAGMARDRILGDAPLMADVDLIDAKE